MNLRTVFLFSSASCSDTRYRNSPDGHLHVGILCLFLLYHKFRFSKDLRFAMLTRSAVAPRVRCPKLQVFEIPVIANVHSICSCDDKTNEIVWDEYQQDSYILHICTEPMARYICSCKQILRSPASLLVSLLGCDRVFSPSYLNQETARGKMIVEFCEIMELIDCLPDSKMILV